ncbi:predicted protein [Naegleria gruberi]|uniref:Predicted protein n=1 Tax=Naegleria gruberi TaxID=5762 RepID=D2W0G2_NAEGR|nr:uncharacterized protein NAEGRDRAFT_74846 [Naegleria gruberi]EFC37471.1 predicted protein [Naegleria gruberi]|eukprot:XP_002670215.1 predicted protein [Naegleria gruberi strain NEG-M]
MPILNVPSLKIFSSKVKTTHLVMEVDSISLKNWTVDNFRQWLIESGYDKSSVVDVIIKHRFDGGSILNIKIEDWLEIGIPKGACLSLISRIDELKTKQIQLGILQLCNQQSTSVTLPPSVNPPSARRLSNATKPNNYPSAEANKTDNDSKGIEQARRNSNVGKPLPIPPPKSETTLQIQTLLVQKSSQ